MGTDTEEKPAITIESLQAQLAEQNSMLEQIKAAQSGSDKAYKKATEELAATRAENERLAKEKMTAAEQAKYDLEQEKAEIAQSKRELAEATLRLTKIKAMEAAGIPARFEKRITGSTDEEIAADILEFQKDRESDLQAELKKTLGNSPKPGGGNAPKGKVDTSTLTFEEAVALEEKGELD